MNDYQLFEFIELYKTLTNLFVSVKDRIGWLREADDGHDLRKFHLFTKT